MVVWAAVVLAHDVALLGEPPSEQRHGWVNQWLGVYTQTPVTAHGRPTFAKADDPSKVIWCTAQGHWHVSREGDVKTGWGLFAARAQADMPDRVSAVWQIASHGRGWTDAPRLFCAPAPPPTVWLYGHAPSGSWLSRGWVASWLGSYDLHPELTNGRCVYSRKAGDVQQLLWFARSESDQPYWFLGPASGLGSSRVWLSVLDNAPVPHRVTATWRVASADDDTAWVRAAGLRVSTSTT